eukprot:c23279_g1_i2 orf=443-1792(-)
MPAAWVAWRRILSCKEDSHLAVYDPKGSDTPAANATPLSNKPRNSTHNINKGSNGVLQNAKKRRSTSSSACCNDLKNVVHGNTRVVHRADQDSPLSHYHGSPHQLKVLIQEPSIFLYSPRLDAIYTHKSAQVKKLSSCYDCSIASCEPPDAISSQCNSLYTHKSAQVKKLSSCYDCSIASCEPPDAISSQCNSYHSRASGALHPPFTCHKCGDSVVDSPEALEEHHATHHSVTELKEGDSARSIVEIIFQTSWLRQDIVCARPERIFKVHNSPKTIAKFEDYRDMVKTKASKISKRQSRCLVDGNELLRFYSTTVACHMGKMRSSTSSYMPPLSSLCTSSSCGVCHILRYGFPTKGQPGIYTNASSGQAHESIMFSKEYDSAVNAKRAMLVCRVIAGRVKKTGYESSQDGPISGYDSVAGEAGLYTDLEELLVFNNRAVLPCFVVVYSC